MVQKASAAVLAKAKKANPGMPAPKNNVGVMSGPMPQGAPGSKPQPKMQPAGTKGGGALAPGIMKKPGGMPPGMGMTKGPGMTKAGPKRNMPVPVARGRKAKR
mgnify:CR=1 FL=1